jgi:hypothetical protein
MKTYSIILLFFSFNLFGQPHKETLLKRQWYYCDSVSEPSKTEYLKLSSKNSICEHLFTEFYWEFKNNGEYEWSDVIIDDTSNVADGVIVIPIDNKWKIENDVLTMGSNTFKIVKLNKRHLIIQRKEN